MGYLKGVIVGVANPPSSRRANAAVVTASELFVGFHVKWRTGSGSHKLCGGFEVDIVAYTLFAWLKLLQNNFHFSSLSVKSRSVV